MENWKFLKRGIMKTGIFTTEGTEDTGVKSGEGCPLITRMNTNEYFAVNLILRHKIKLTAKASVLLVLPLCGMPFVDKKGFWFMAGNYENMGNISHEDAETRRENRSQWMYANTPHSFADSCTIFIFFKPFMVKTGFNSVFSVSSVVKIVPDLLVQNVKNVNGE